jgi:ornithine cyclodeaminase/alanine dehydrogenase-like protein (mu-crystallin family)
MRLRILSAADVQRALPMPAAIEAMRGAFRALDQGEVVMPVRLGLPVPEGIALFMPAFIASSGGLGQKMVSVFGNNARRELPMIHAIVTLFDAETGEPRALLEGTYLTALRTGAVSGLATDVLAREDARVLTIFGAGGQARAQIEAVCATRPIEEIHLVSLGDSARRLAEQLQEEDPARRYSATRDREAVVRSADVIVTATSSATPVFDGAWVQPGTHVNAVGSYRPDMQEVDATLLRRALVIVDQREAALEEAGDLLVPMQAGEWAIEQLYGELGALVSGSLTIPPGPERITYFKSCGLAMEDVAAAQAVLAVAEAEALGQVVEL